MPWPLGKILKPCAFSEEDICVVSKEDTCQVWAGAKILYSGRSDGTPQQASGYNYQSGETDVEPIEWASGFWGEIRIPELAQLHKIFVFPKNPTWIARADYTTLTLGTSSGQPYGHGGCSGKIALLRYMNICSGCTTSVSGEIEGILLSGIVDVIAFGSKY